MTSQEIRDAEAKATARWDLKDIDAEPGALSEPEIFWRDHQLWLEEHGYMLRPRYRPDWVPSWKGSRKQWQRCEDGQSPKVSLLAT